MSRNEMSWERNVAGNENTGTKIQERKSRNEITGTKCRGATTVIRRVFLLKIPKYHHNRWILRGLAWWLQLFSSIWEGKILPSCFIEKVTLVVFACGGCSSVHQEPPSCIQTSGIRCSSSALHFPVSVNSGELIVNTGDGKEGFEWKRPNESPFLGSVCVHSAGILDTFHRRCVLDGTYLRLRRF